MQIWTPVEQPHDNGDFAVRFVPGNGQPFAIITLSQQGGSELCMQSPGDCDRLIRAAAEARDLLLGEAANHPFIRPGQVAGAHPAPDACMACGRPEGEHPAGTDAS